ncbi:MAG: hypothetical protein JW716_00490 [Candidatus Aenigmarchaeota archaeon]|nr:hypothetical protein [Candidatus Aenigmarchaeota archaeon]
MLKSDIHNKKGMVPIWIVGTIIFSIMVIAAAILLWPKLFELLMGLRG